MKLIVYGSLMNSKEFSASSPKKIMIKDWKRILNRNAMRSHWNPKGKESAVLNIMKSPGDSFNAICYDISDKEYEELRLREIEYHTITVPIYDYEARKHIGTSVIFVSNEKNNMGEKILLENISPIKKYLEVCRRGAYSWGKEFGEMFDRTTFLADGTTSVKEYSR
ncbi:gamma-glutamylcyclotransferase [Candidatus Woesearchaeota archaeon]|nr:gamma-glutamylcyclotransferase [Candidatus Woesearchaeota archaeon]